MKVTKQYLRSLIKESLEEMGGIEEASGDAKSKAVSELSSAVHATRKALGNYKRAAGIITPAYGGADRAGMGSIYEGERYGEDDQWVKDLSVALNTAMKKLSSLKPKKGIPYGGADRAGMGSSGEEI